MLIICISKGLDFHKTLFIYANLKARLCGLEAVISKQAIMRQDSYKFNTLTQYISIPRQCLEGWKKGN